MFLPLFLYMSLGIYVKFSWLYPRNTHLLGLTRYTDVQLYTIWLTFWGQMKLQWPLAPGENVDKMYWEGLSWRVCGGNWAATLYRIDHGAHRNWDREGNPLQSPCFQGVSPWLGKRRTWQTESPGRQRVPLLIGWYLHLGLGGCVSLVYLERKGLSGTEFHPLILPQWSLPISFISLCICTLWNSPSWRELLLFPQMRFGEGSLAQSYTIWVKCLRANNFPF